MKGSATNSLVCPTCRAIFPDEQITKKLITNKELMAQVSYLQTAILEIGKTNTNLMKKIKDNYKAIQTLKGKK